VGSPSGSSQLSPGGHSAEMISDRRPHANCQVLVKGVGEDLLPTPQIPTLNGTQGKASASAHVSAGARRRRHS
jgi:hypothetical protein